MMNDETMMTKGEKPSPSARVAVKKAIKFFRARSFVFAFTPATLTEKAGLSRSTGTGGEATAGHYGEQ